ncbi:hypothetical protein GLOIN_2v1571072 [Rhizophagus irregularis DAOM 181602=DAOM 197198]|nr:hypothetical protein GLOIN_2v1571072 [Rhizophagus irregularis DAOM 181602=DAOM 197198]CAG8668064.1 22367_t:CDS:2 [Rhizophagus irregularis]
MNIWFKYRKGEPVEISFKGNNVNALKKQIKTELKNQLGKFDINQITLRKPGEHKTLCAEMLIDEGFATKNYLEMKTFHIQCYDNEGMPLDKFEQFEMRNNEDFSKLLKRVEARGLENIEDNNKVSKIITSLEDIQTNKFYRISASYLYGSKKWFYVDTSRGCRIGR